MASKKTYPETVDELLEMAGRSRSKHHSSMKGYEVDHVIELQLVVKGLENTRYRRQGWATEIVDFFNSKLNLKDRPKTENRKKGYAASRLKDGSDPKPGDDKWIKEIRSKWMNIRDKLHDFLQFKGNLNKLLQC